jgi:hypothetical protein
MNMSRAVTLLLAGIGLSGCGLAGLDGYGRPVACPGPGKPSVPLKGDWTCAGTMPTLAGDLLVNDPRVTAQLVEASQLVAGPVAYTDGKMTRTYVPSF